MVDSSGSHQRRYPSEVLLYSKVEEEDLEDLCLDKPTLLHFSEEMIQLFFCFTSVFQSLHHWPPPGSDSETLAFAQDYQAHRIEHNGCAFYESGLTREDLHRIDSGLAKTRCLRFFFWIDDKNDKVWILRVRWTRTNKAPRYEYKRVARRLHALKSGNHDLRTD